MRISAPSTDGAITEGPGTGSVYHTEEWCNHPAAYLEFFANLTWQKIRPTRFWHLFEKLVTKREDTFATVQGSKGHKKSFYQKRLFVQRG